MKIGQKALALVLALTMVVSTFFSTAVFAAEGNLPTFTIYSDSGTVTYEITSFGEGKDSGEVKVIYVAGKNGKVVIPSTVINPDKGIYKDSGFCVTAMEQVMCPQEVEASFFISEGKTQKIHVKAAYNYLQMSKVKNGDAELSLGGKMGYIFKQWVFKDGSISKESTLKISDNKSCSVVGQNYASLSSHRLFLCLDPNGHNSSGISTNNEEYKPADYNWSIKDNSIASCEADKDKPACTVTAKKMGRTTVTSDCSEDPCEVIVVRTEAERTAAIKIIEANTSVDYLNAVKAFLALSNEEQVDLASLNIADISKLENLYEHAYELYNDDFVSFSADSVANDNKIADLKAEHLLIAATNNGADEVKEVKKIMLTMTQKDTASAEALSFDAKLTENGDPIARNLAMPVKVSFTLPKSFNLNEKYEVKMDGVIKPIPFDINGNTGSFTAYDKLSSFSVVKAGQDKPDGPGALLLNIQDDQWNPVVGETKTFAIDVTPGDAKVTWSSSDSKVVTVDENGNAKAISAGDATITASSGNLSDFCTVKVTAMKHEEEPGKEEEKEKKAEEETTNAFKSLPDDSKTDFNAEEKQAIANAVAKVLKVSNLAAFDLAKLEKLLANFAEVVPTTLVVSDEIKDSGMWMKEKPQVSNLLLAAGVTASDTKVPVKLETSQVAPTKPGATLALKFDLALGGEAVHDLKVPVTVSFKLPDNFGYNSAYDYKIYHNDETTPMDNDLKVDGGVGSFKTKAFSTFTIVPKEKSTGGSSGGGGSHHSSSHFGSSVTAAAAATFVSDTTKDFSVNGSYQFKITSSDGTAPALTAGTPGVFDIQLVKTAGNDYFIKLTAIGKPGAGTGIYLNGTRLLVATVGSTAAVVSNAKSDTTGSFKVKVGGSYTFKVTANAKPTFTVATASAFKVELVKVVGKDYFYKVTATGKAGSGSGFFVNSTRVAAATITK